MFQRSKKGPGAWVESVDFSVLDVADQESIAKLAEIVRSLDDPPGVHKRARARRVSGKMIRGQQIAVSIKDVHHASERGREAAEGDVELAVLILNLERSVSEVLTRNGWCWERAKRIESTAT